MIGQASRITKSSPNWVAVWESLISRIFEWLRGVKLDPEILPAAVDIRDFEQVPQDDPLFKYRDTPTVQSPGMAPQQTLDYVCEIFELLQRLFLGRAALASRVVVCCAIEQRREINYICAQAAELLTDLSQGSAVCVVDANLDRPSLHTYFDVQNRRGLADAMLETGLILGIFRDGETPTGFAAIVVKAVHERESQLKCRRAARGASRSCEHRSLSRLRVDICRGDTNYHV